MLYMICVMDEYGNVLFESEGMSKYECQLRLAQWFSKMEAEGGHHLIIYPVGEKK